MKLSRAERAQAIATLQDKFEELIGHSPRGISREEVINACNRACDYWEVEVAHKS